MTMCKDCGIETTPGDGSARCSECWESRVDYCPSNKVADEEILKAAITFSRETHVEQLQVCVKAGFVRGAKWMHEKINQSPSGELRDHTSTSKVWDEEIGNKIGEIMERVWPFEKYAEGNMQINRGTVAVKLREIADWVRDKISESPSKDSDSDSELRKLKKQNERIMGYFNGEVSVFRDEASQLMVEIINGYNGKSLYFRAKDFLKTESPLMRASDTAPVLRDELGKIRNLISESSGIILNDCGGLTMKYGSTVGQELGPSLDAARDKIYEARDRIDELLKVTSESGNKNPEETKGDKA